MYSKPRETISSELKYIHIGHLHEAETKCYVFLKTQDTGSNVALVFDHQDKFSWFPSVPPET